MTKSKKETNLRKIKNANVRLDNLEEERALLSRLIRQIRKELKTLIRK
jgi:hypothetical protein